MRKQWPIIFILLLIFSLGVNIFEGLSLLRLRQQNVELKKEVKTLKKALKKTKGKEAEAAADFIPSGPPEVLEAYSFAQENQGVLKKMNCYCGCQMPTHIPNHKNLANCFVQKITTKGKVIYDEHGQNCKTCVDEALDVKKWLEEGKNTPEISKLIDEKYGSPHH